MNVNSKKKENISPSKVQSSQIDISEKPLEQTSIILPSSEKKQNTSSLANSESNIVQMNINNNNEKSINMSNEEINFSELNPFQNKLLSDIIIPSEENDNEEEIEIDDINMKKGQNNKHIIKTTITTTKILDGNNKIKEEIQKETKNDLSPENINDNSDNVKINEKTIQIPTTTKVKTTTIYNNNRKIIKQTKKIENNKDKSSKNDNDNNISIKIEKELPTMIEKISRTEIKENKNDSINEDNNSKLKTESKNSKKLSEIEEKNIAKKILFNNIKYDFDNSQNEEDENALLGNKFEIIQASPEKIHNRVQSNDILEKMQNIPSFNNNIIIEEDENKNELKNSIQTLASANFGIPNEGISNSNFSFGVKKTTENNLKESEKIDSNNPNSQNIFVSFGVKNENTQNYIPLPNTDIKFGVTESIIIQNNKEQKQNEIKEEENQDNLPILDTVIKFGINEENEIKTEEKELNNENKNITLNNNENEEKEEINIGQKVFVEIKEEKKDGEKIKSLFDNDGKGIDTSKIFSQSINQNENEEDDEKKMKDNKPAEGLFYENFNKDKKELNLNLPLNYENKKFENPFINTNDPNNNFNTLLNKNNKEFSLFGDKDLFGNEGMKKGGFTLFNSVNKNDNEKLPIVNDIIKSAKDNNQEKVEEKNIFMNITNTNENIFKTTNTEENKNDSMKNNDKTNEQINSNIFSTQDNTLNLEKKEEIKKQNNNQIISPFTTNINKNEEIKKTKSDNPFISALNEKEKNNEENKTQNKKEIKNNNPFLLFDFSQNQKIEKENKFTNEEKNENPFNNLLNKETISNNNPLFSNTNESMSNNNNPFKIIFKKEENQENNKEKNENEKINTNNPFLNNIFNVEKEKISNVSLFDKNDSDKNISSSLFSTQNNLSSIFLSNPNDVDINKKTFSVFEENNNENINTNNTNEQKNDEKETTLSIDKGEKKDENKNIFGEISLDEKDKLFKANSINKDKNIEENKNISVKFGINEEKPLVYQGLSNENIKFGFVNNEEEKKEIDKIK